MSGQILIVEPTPTHRIVLRALLLRARYRVEQCEDIATARKLIAGGLHPDLILLRTSDAEATGHHAGDVERLADTFSDLKCSASAPGLMWVVDRPTLSKGVVPLIIAIDDTPVADHEPEDRSERHTRCRTDPTHQRRAAARLRALLAGADDVISRPFPDSVLLARIRKLLRARAELEDLRPRSSLDLVDGFAEQAETYDMAQRIVILTPSALPPADAHTGAEALHAGLCPALAGLVARDPSRFEIIPITADFNTTDSRSHGGTDDFDDEGLPPDLVIIDAAVGAPGGMVPGDIFRLLAELRSRTPLRLAAQLLILPPDTPDLAVMALDMAVDDLVTEDVSRGELSHRIETLLRQKRVSDGLRISVRQGLEAAVIDPLTGLHNRRFAMPHLAMAAREAHQSRTPLAIMMLDIDHFKEINDTFGHATGDVILCDFARRLKSVLRPRDLLARIGGEEFLVVLPGTTEAEAREIGERLRGAIAARPFDGNATDASPPDPVRSRISVTVSVGVALEGSDQLEPTSPSALIERADAALFAAKDSGRNKVTLSASAA